MLSLFLKIIRTGGSTVAVANTSPRSASTPVGNVVNSVRGVGLTCLALLLRYTTFIDPPPDTKSTETHLLPTLIAIIKDLSRNPTNKVVDPKLKRFAVAALGEIVFYISAQEADEGNKGNTQPKWQLPQDAIVTLNTCILEDTDEIVRHYACKVYYIIFQERGHSKFIIYYHLVTFSIIFVDN